MSLRIGVYFVGPRQGTALYLRERSPPAQNEQFYEIESERLYLP